MRSWTLALPLLVVVAGMSTPAFATFLPPNNLYLEDNLYKLANMTQAEFDAIIDGVAAKYTSIVEAHGAKLTFNHKWNDATVNASASQTGKTWTVNMYGGLARRDEVTRDGFAAVVCHELGHHLGGFAFYGPTDWAASEGQSDYFTTHACLPLLWGDQTEENAKYRATVPALVKQQCDGVWATEARQNLCYRINDSGASLANLLAALGNSGKPRFETPDPTQVTTSSTSHPAAQCRLDTYFQGSLCPVSFDSGVIPGRNHPSGQNSIAVEELSAQSTCHASAGYAVGIRPRCWFKPNVDFRALKLDKFVVAESVGNGNGVLEPGEVASIKATMNNALVDKTNTDVKGTVWAKSNNAQVLRGEVTYPDLAPNQASEGDGVFEVQVGSSAACGSVVNLGFRGTSSLGSFEVSKDLTVGREFVEEVGSGSTATKIPDGDPKGVSIPVEIVSEGPAQGVKLTVDIDHAYPRDLGITLISPAGVKTVLLERFGKDIPVGQKGIKQDFVVKTLIPETKGSWQILFVDGARRVQGTLKSWNLALLRNICE